MNFHQKYGTKVMMLLVFLCFFIVLFTVFITPDVQTDMSKNYIIATSLKMPKNKVKQHKYIHNIKCKDTVWVSDICIDSNYTVWLNPNTRVCQTYSEYRPIFVTKLESENFVIDLSKCQDDYKWIMYTGDFKSQGFYKVHEILYKGRLK